ncbi:MAG: bifunctional UDP-N-acetylglucosamine diphosphorylase/glucosamine-1-phosphate N-acetyltransferase GlmU [bacterium]|nr:bifunctional UDP-N-acetylglucosamine diphosphorylase/glucosamine-1-phosphate N-acetyltransferase GlmU [bacterium]
MASGDLALVLMAAGKGTRMRSSLPKVLHPVCGRPILMHAVQLGRELGARRVVAVVGSGEDQVREVLADEDVEIVVQSEQLGTAHAALQARALLEDHEGPVLVMNGDHPLYRASTFNDLLDTYRKGSAELAILVAEFPNPTGYGRIVRNSDGSVARVIEEDDADAATKEIREVNLGAYLASSELLFQCLSKVGNDNAKSEYYLTDVIEIAAQEGRRVETSSTDDWTETLGVNSRVELAEAERLMRRRLAEYWMREGVSFVDPDCTYLDCDVEIGPDTRIEPGVTLKSGTRIGSGCRIDSGAVIENTTIGDDCWIKPQCWLEGARLAARVVVGPSAHLRPDTDLADDVRVGNYVEIKNSRLGPGTKADHLSYLGDSDVGSGVTIGCGAITVNYDGTSKSRTVIGDRVFVGCNSNLIAPVEIESGAYIAAGSTINKEVPDGALAIARARQRNIEGWRDRRFGKKDGKD